MSERQPRYWLVEGLSYSDEMDIISSDLIENHTRDVRKNISRFWPASVGVLHYLREKLPNVTIHDDMYEDSVEFKRPTIVHKRGSAGMDIAE